MKIDYTQYDKKHAVDNLIKIYKLVKKYEASDHTDMEGLFDDVADVLDHCEVGDEVLEEE